MKLDNAPMGVLSKREQQHIFLILEHCARALLTHPVVETYLDLKWLNVRYYFIGK